MRQQRPAVSRRGFLNRLAAVGGAGAVYHGLTTLGLLAVPPAYAGIPAMPAGLGKGRRVAILGAGMAGLTAALLLARAGFEVRVVEANRHIGGRSLTVRPGDSYAEVGREALTCRFDDGLYLNAGPGRIPQHHTAVLEYCRELGVAMEPYIFASRANLMQSDKAFGGHPIQLRRIKHELRGQIAEMLAKVSDPSALDASLGADDRSVFLEMLSEFGALQRRGDALVYRGSGRAGYALAPGAGRTPGSLWPEIELKTLLDSGFWKNGLFNDMVDFWQTSLLQPTGGMDMIVHGLLRAAIPGGRTVRDLVVTESPVVEVANTATGVTVVHAKGTETADFCISTMAPSLLAGMKNNFSPAYARALSAVADAPAFKLGWQARHRFWEENDHIYGGISWTDHPITQIWYPSDEYFAPTGVLTGAYNNGARAELFGELSHADRVALALEGGEKLHSGFSNWVYQDRALSIAWHKMPHFAGGWQTNVPEADPDAYFRLTVPEGNVMLAGDFLSYWWGWKEGAIRSADQAVNAIVSRVAHSGAAAGAARQ